MKSNGEFGRTALIGYALLSLATVALAIIFINLLIASIKGTI